MNPTGSVVVCTRNRVDVLAECLSSLACQVASPDQFEVIVVDNASTDRTATFLGGWAAGDPIRHRIVTEERAGLSRARNRGFEEARHEIVLFIDDDALAHEGWGSNSESRVRYALSGKAQPGARASSDAEGNGRGVKRPDSVHCGRRNVSGSAGCEHGLDQKAIVGGDCAQLAEQEPLRQVERLVEQPAAVGVARRFERLVRGRLRCALGLGLEDQIEVVKRGVEVPSRPEGRKPAVDPAPEPERTPPTSESKLEVRPPWKLADPSRRVSEQPPPRKPVVHHVVGVEGAVQGGDQTRTRNLVAVEVEVDSPEHCACSHVRGRLTGSR